MARSMVLPGGAGGSYIDRQVVGRAYAPYQGVTGGAFYDRHQAAREARAAVNLVALVANRKARRDKLGPLAPRPTRAAVAGGRTIVRPAGRSA